MQVKVKEAVRDIRNPVCVVTAKATEGEHDRSIPGSFCSHWGQCQAGSGSTEGRDGPFPQGNHGRLPGGAVPQQPHTAVWQTTGGALLESQRQHTFWEWGRWVTAGQKWA